MATLEITEFTRLAGDTDGRVIQAGMCDASVTEQTPVSFGASTQSAVFGSSTRIVRVKADAAAYLQFGSNPTATTSSIGIEADTPEYFGVKPGDKVAVYDGIT